MTKQQLIEMGISEELAEKVAAAAEQESREATEKLNTELEGVRAQLEEANGKIAEFEKMDIEGVKAAASAWQEKYEKDTADLKQTLADKEYDFALDKYMSGYKFSSELARQAAVSAMRDKKFKLDENGKFLGADDFMTELKKSNPAAFEDGTKSDKVPFIMTGTGAKTDTDAAARSVMGLK